MKRPLLALLFWLLHLVQPVGLDAQCSANGEDCCCAPAAASEPACCAAERADDAAPAVRGAPVCGCWELPETPVEPQPPALPEGREAPTASATAGPPAAVTLPPVTPGAGVARSEVPPGRAVPIWLAIAVLRL